MMKRHFLVMLLTLSIANVAAAQRGGGGMPPGGMGGMGMGQVGMGQGGMSQMGMNQAGMGQPAATSGFGTGRGLGNAGGFSTGSGFGNSSGNASFGNNNFGSSQTGGSGMGNAMGQNGGGFGQGMPAGFGNFSPFSSAMGMNAMGMNSMGMGAMGMNRGMGGMMGGMGGMGGRNGMNQFGNNNQNGRNQSKIRTSVKLGFTAPPAVATARAAQIQTRLANIPTTVSGASGIQVVMEGRTAVLRGNVASQADDRMMQRLVSLEPGVSSVRSELNYPGKSQASEGSSSNSSNGSGNGAANSQSQTSSSRTNTPEFVPAAQ